MNLFWQQIPSPQITTIYCQSSFNGVVFDDEHGCFNSETLFSLIQIVKASGKKSFVRFSDLNKAKVRHCLDAGLDGIIFSTVDNLEYAESIIDYCYYPPRGKRGQGLVCENEWGDRQDLLQNRAPIVIAQIENRAGIDLLDDISDKFEYFMLGPYDLSADLGSVGDWDNEKYKHAINTFENKVSLEKRCVHVVTNIKKELENKFKEYTIKAMGMDTTFLKSSIHYYE
jgi:2-keto-3-deoxy-L-rhamnonate aldolase RhmA